MRTMTFVLALLVCLPAVAFADDACEAWSIKGLHLGMTIPDLERAGFSPAETSYSPLKWSPDGSQWWKGKRGNEVRLMALQNVSGKDEAPIVALRVAVSVPTKDGISVKSVLDSLIARWGAPDVPEAVVSDVEYTNGFGAMRERTTTYRTTWEAKGCDMQVWVERSTGMVGQENPGFTVWLVSRSQVFIPMHAHERAGVEQVLAPPPPPTEAAQ